MEGRGGDKEKEGKKNHRDPVIPLKETHRFLFNLFLRGSQPCGVRKSNGEILLSYYTPTIESLK